MSSDILPASYLISPVNAQPIRSAGYAQASRCLEVALICMPWSSVAMPSIAMGILKQCVKRTGCSPTLHYLNVRFAQQIGVLLYEGISSRSHIYPEWFFSPALFGQNGTGEFVNDWNALRENPEAKRMVSRLKEYVDGSEETCRDIAEVQVPRFIDACMEEIDWTKYDVVGFTTTFAQSLSSLLLAWKIRQVNPTCAIVFGGANVDSEMGVEALRAFGWIDYVVHGEGEEAFPELLVNIANGERSRGVKGVSHRADDQIIRGDQDQRPVVDMRISPQPDYGEFLDTLNRFRLRNQVELRLFYESSRGCWWGKKHHCTFCGLNGTTMDYRQKDADRVYEEILDLAERYECLKLAAADNILATDYFKKLLPRLAEADLDLSLFYEVKANLRREQVQALHDAGVTAIQPGIESFNSRLLKLMNKGVTAIQNIQLLKHCLELGVRPSWNILYGFPGEEAQDYADLADIFQMISHCQPPDSLGQILFERFSPYHFDRERYGLTLWPYHSYQFIYPHGKVNLERIAYFFEGEWKGKSCEPDSYITDARTAHAAWQKHWVAGKLFCYYEKGPQCLFIYDSRPRNKEWLPVRRRLRLDKTMSAIYLFCDEHRSGNAVTEMAAEYLGITDRDRIQNILEHFVTQRLMFREQDRYLSLAIRKKPIHGRVVS